MILSKIVYSCLHYEIEFATFYVSFQHLIQVTYLFLKLIIPYCERVKMANLLMTLHFLFCNISIPSGCFHSFLCSSYVTCITITILSFYSIMYASVYGKINNIQIKKSIKFTKKNKGEQILIIPFSIFSNEQLNIKQFRQFIH